MPVERSLIEAAQRVPDAVQFDWGTGLRVKPEYLRPLQQNELVVVQNGNPEAPVWLSSVKEVVLKGGERAYRVIKADEREEMIKCRKGTKVVTTTEKTELIFDGDPTCVGQYASRDGKYRMYAAQRLGPKGLSGYGIDIMNPAKRVFVK